MCVWPFNGTSKTKKAAKNYVHKEETKEYPFSSGGTLHVENENNNSDSNSGNVITSQYGTIFNNKGTVITSGTVTVNGKTYQGKSISIRGNQVVIDGKIQDTNDANPNNITIEGHDKELLELFIKTESNDGDLECVSSELNIDEKNAFIKTVYKTKDCQASRSYTLKVPKKTFIKLLLTTRGSITAENIDGNIEEAQTISGNIFLQKINGSISAKTSSGDNTLDSIQGNATVFSSSGDNQCSHINGIVNVQSSSGNNTIDHAKNVISQSSSGKNTLETIEENGTVFSSSGDNRCSHVNGTVKAQSSSGNNTMNDAKSVIAKSSSGKITLASIQEEITANTSSGSITVKLGDYRDATIEASTNSGQCKSDVPVNGTKEKKKIKGTIGKGGPLKSFKTSSGNINIKK